MRPNLNSAEFNLREIVKNMILLEDHLNDKEKFCVDCIRKHLLTIEAYAEEAMNLEPSGRFVNECERVSSFAREIIAKFHDGANVSHLSQRVRSFRKDLVPLVFDHRKK